MSLLNRARIAGRLLALVSSTAVGTGVASAGTVPCPPCPCPPRVQSPCPPAATMPIPADPGAALPPVVPTPQAAAAPTPSAPSARAFQAGAPSEAGFNELAFSDAGAGYIDIAVPRTMFRLRYDAAFNGDFSIDRAEYFYPAYQTFATRGGGIIGGADATSDVDYQEVHAYLEYAFSERFSTFVNVPFRWVDPTLTNVEGIDVPSGSGLSDVWFGLKYALVATPRNFLTFQLKLYTPTGDEEDALGTGHTSLEPGLLFQTATTQDLTLFGEAKYWIPFDTTEIPAGATGASGDYSDGVFQYGAGGALDLFERCTWKLQGVTEFVGWTTIDSLQGDPTTETLARDADGDTIVNLKLGARWSRLERGRERSSIYAGWGHALTDVAWYEDLFRLEYRVAF